MREALIRRSGKTCLYRATFVRYGLRKLTGIYGETVVISDVEDEKGKYISSHLWFNSSKPFKKLDLEAGDRIEFTARVEQYRRKNGSKDFRLSLPTKIRIVED